MQRVTLIGWPFIFSSVAGRHVLSWWRGTLPPMPQSSCSMHMRTIGHQMGKLLHDWLHTTADAQVCRTLALPARLQLVYGLKDLIRSYSREMSLDWEDVQAILSNARGIWLGKAQAAGPERALLVAEQVWTSGLQVGPGTGLVQELLLVLRTGREEAVQVEELAALLEAVQLRVGAECNVEFEFDTDDGLENRMEAMLLVGYG